MATKEVMVTVPLAVAAWYFLFGDPDDAARRRQFANVGALAVTWVVLAGLVIAEHRGPSVALDAATIWSYLLTQGEVIVHYVRLSLWPAPLVFLYTWPLTASWGQAPYVLGVMAALGLTLYGLLRRNPLAYAGVLFFLVLAPTSSVLPIVTEVAAEHRMYLPLAALVASFVVGLWRVVDALVSRRDSGERSTRLPLIATTAVVVALMGPLAVATRARNRDYSSEERLWADTVAKQPANQRARVAYGMALAATGRWADAERELREAVALEPRDPVANSRLGVILATAGQFDAALVHLDRAAAVRPGDIETQRALGRIRVMRREDAQALRHLESVLAAQPDDPSVLLQIAGLLVDSSDASVRNPGRAVRLSEQALRIVGRRDPRILNLLSAALAADGRLADAAAAASDGAAAARAAGDEALASALEERATRYRAAPAPWMR
jgi:Flp pilus assembly protein TadD